ncbi:PEP-CTERM sorting domain-containing protein [Thiobacillus sp.]|uniref:PEP-CTERM sorting domain-containing protein n=1 Tax=Thiobacillus sp. TaxID=924 RepID=UPI0011DAE443|nr:PEP-CTERM sorting domain-containing protein [Thiobacillus sp.]TXH74220.1 MAG: PEP-CTERM sorting domain-containing protein [Thiobacillus sp.]
MHVRLTTLAAALMIGVTPAWATDLPAYETYSAAADFGTNFFSSDPTYTQLLDTTATPGATAQISGSGYTASASTSLGSNHTYASASTMPSNVLSAGSFSGWYDQVTITGGSGTGTANFTVQLNGTVDVGAMAGGLGYTLGASSVHPSLLTSNTLTFNAINTTPWALDAATPIASYLIGASPYNDTSILFSSTPYPTDPTSGGILGIPALDPSLGGGTGMGFPTPDLVLTPGSGQSVNVTLHGTLNFTYGEAFYLIGGLGASVIGDGLQSFCSFTVGDTCTPPVKDGSGATTLDFSNSANLINIALPEGATASFASGNVYNVTTVPEPDAWLMLLAGLGLVGWRARRRA